MNKIMMFPLFVMLVISILAFATMSSSIPTQDDIQLTGHYEGYFYNEGTEILFKNNETGSIYHIVPDVVGDGFAFYNPDIDKTVHYMDEEDFWSAEIESEDESWKLFNPTYLIVALGAALVVSGAAGVYIIGSGVSEWSQRLIFVSAMWTIVWGGLTLISYNFIFASVNDVMVLGGLGTYLYMALTIMYVIGFVVTVQEAG